MRVPNMTMSDGVVDRLNTLRGQQNKLNQELSTGQRFMLPSEDPQAASRVMSLRSEMAVTQQYARNSGIASGVSQASGSALSNLYSDCYLNATEIVASASSGNVSQAERSAYATTVNQLVLQAIQLGNTRFNQQYIFNGTDIANPPYVGVSTDPGDSDAHPTSVTGPQSDASGNPPGDGIAIKLSDSLSISPYSRGESNAKLTSFISRLISLRDALEDNDSARIQTTGNDIKSSEADLANMIAENGAQGSRLDSLKASMEIRFADVGDLIGRESSVDIAQTMVNLTKTQTAYQAAMQAGAQILKLSLLDYIR